MCFGCVAAPILGAVLGPEAAAIINKRGEALFGKETWALLGKRAKPFVLDPRHPFTIKLASILLTILSSLTTASGVKYRFNVSFCGTDPMTVKRAAVLVVGSSLVGLIYSFVISYLLNRMFPFPSDAGPGSCCLNNAGV